MRRREVDRVCRTDVDRVAADCARTTAAENCRASRPGFRALPSAALDRRRFERAARSRVNVEGKKLIHRVPLRRARPKQHARSGPAELAPHEVDVNLRELFGRRSNRPPNGATSNDPRLSRRQADPVWRRTCIQSRAARRKRDRIGRHGPHYSPRKRMEILEANRCWRATVSRTLDHHFAFHTDPSSSRPRKPGGKLGVQLLTVSVSSVADYDGPSRGWRKVVDAVLVHSPRFNRS